MSEDRSFTWSFGNVGSAVILVLSILGVWKAVDIFSWLFY